MFAAIGLAVLSGLGCRYTHPGRWIHLPFRGHWPYRLRSNNCSCSMTNAWQLSTFPRRRIPAFIPHGIKASLCADVRIHAPVATRTLGALDQTDMVTWPAARAKAKQAGPTARARGRQPIGSNSKAALIVLWIRYALRSRTFGAPPARVHSGENVWSLNLRQSTMVISVRPSAFQLERSQETERLLL